MEKKTIAEAPIWDDIRTLEGHGAFGSTIDIIVAGFPCQDISVAGHGKGLAGERSGLVFEVFRLAKEIKPSFIFLENVRGITCRGGLQVVKELADLGYDCRWCVMSAASVGALHRRERWFLLAHAQHSGRNGSEIDRGATEGLSNSQEGKNSTMQSQGMDSPGNVADTGFICERCLQEPGKEDPSSFHHPRCCRFWETEPSVGRVVDGLPKRVDRIRALGNAVVPRQAKEAFKILMGLK